MFWRKIPRPQLAVSLPALEFRDSCSRRSENVGCSCHTHTGLTRPRLQRRSQIPSAVTETYSAKSLWLYRVQEPANSNISKGSPPKTSPSFRQSPPHGLPSGGTAAGVRVFGRSLRRSSSPGGAFSPSRDFLQPLARRSGAGKPSGLSGSRLEKENSSQISKNGYKLP